MKFKSAKFISKQPTHCDPIDSAKAVGLRYVRDDMPGIRRHGSAEDFCYVDPRGRTVRDQTVLKRIRSLAIPPAWAEVWICPDEQGHLQATGRDARGRKQYRYHPRWREVRDETKFNRMVAFGKALPKIRQQVRRDLRKEGLPRTKVLASVVRLLELTLIRVGNDEYARDNRSFGLTTLQDKHAEISGPNIRFHFRGKGGKHHSIEVDDQRLARIVKSCRDLPGQELFQYIDDNGKRQDVASGDVNDYLREITGRDFTAKDFRTWAGTVLAAVALRELEAFDSKAGKKKKILRAIEHVAEQLGNTPSICRKCYIHPVVLEAYLDGTTIETIKRRAEKQMAQSLNTLRPEEAAVLGLLQQRLARDADGLNGFRRAFSRINRHRSSPKHHHQRRNSLLKFDSARRDST